MEVHEDQHLLQAAQALANNFSAFLPAAEAALNHSGRLARATQPEIDSRYASEEMPTKAFRSMNAAS